MVKIKPLIITAMAKLQKSKEKVIGLFNEKVNDEFFRKNYIGIYSTLSSYLIMKKAYHAEGVYHYGDFQNAFSQFYGIKRFVSEKFMNDYYGKLHHLKGQSTCIVKDLTKELIDKEAKGKNNETVEKVQFSFVTKLLNIMNDAEYPIYDLNVATAFGFSAPYSQDVDVKIDKYVELYDTIKDAYKEIIDTQHEKIDSFRKVFNCTNDADVTDMRIVDIITWKLGEEILKQKEQASKDKKKVEEIPAEEMKDFYHDMNLSQSNQ